MAGYLRTQAVSCYLILNAVLIPKYFDISLLSKTLKAQYIGKEIKLLLKTRQVFQKIRF